MNWWENDPVADVTEARRLSGGGRAGGTTAQARSQAFGKIAAARTLGKQLDRVEALYRRQLGGKRSLEEYLPTPANKEFDAAAEGLMPLARQAFRVPGSGADTEREGLYLERILPNRFSYDEANEQRIKQLRQMITDVESEYGPIAGTRATTEPQQPQMASRVIDFNDLP